MEYLSNDFISGLLQEQAVKKANRRRRMFCIDGTVYSGRPPVEMLGSFEGKVGTVTRSRKGRMRRNPNGSRRYNGSEPNVQYYTT